MDHTPSNIKKIETEYDECNIRGICSISPTLAAIKSTIFACLQESAFYIIKLRELGATNEKIKNTFIEIFSVLTTNFEYSEENLYKIVSIIFNNINELKIVYKKLCTDKNVTPTFFKSNIKLNINFKLGDAMKQGKKYEDKYKQNFSEEQRKIHELIFLILKSICFYIVELQSLNVDIDKYYLEILSAVYVKDFYKMTSEQMKEYMYKYSQLDHELMDVLFKEIKKEFGDFIETEILTSTKAGKAVLVSGTNIKELELLLEATKDKGINVYTHGQMITGHTFQKLKEYPHLAGHYGKGPEYYMSDFSSFPGVIFLTKLSMFRVDNLYQNRIFTTNKVAPKNTTTINDYNFEPLINAALSYEGFTETSPEIKINVGVIEKDYEVKVKELKDRISNGEIKNVFIMGISSKFDEQVEYFKKFFKVLGKDSFVISFYYQNDFKNILFVNIDYAFPFLYKVLQFLVPLKESCGLKINLFSTRCEPHTIPNIIYMYQIGVDKIYFNQCSPFFVNPALVDFMLDYFDIKCYTTPESDLKYMLEN